MKYLKQFETHNSEWQEKSDAMISRGSLSIYEFGSYSSFKSFVEENQEIFNTIPWSINPITMGTWISGDGQRRNWAETYFDAYMGKDTNFYVLIDYELKKVFGISVKKVGSEIKVVSFDQSDRRIPHSELEHYMKKLHIKIEDLI